jgi:hypothetical protein
MTENLIEHFMKTRKGRGKQNTQAILNFLRYRLDCNNGWVQTRDLHTYLVDEPIPEGPTLFNLLRDLTRYQVIERREEIVPTSRSRPNKTKSFVYYWLSHLAFVESILSPEEHAKVERAMKIRMHELQLELVAAKKVLENHNLMSEYWQMIHVSDEFANYRKFLQDLRRDA